MSDGVRCKHCAKEFGLSSLAPTQKQHLLNCKNVPNQIKSRILVLDSGSCAGEKRSSQLLVGSSRSQRKLKWRIIEGDGKVTRKESDTIDEALVAFVASTGVSFRLTENPFFLDLVSALRRQYIPPTRFRLAGALLDKIYAQTREKVDASI